MPLRHAAEADLPRIVEIYNASIPGGRATADTEPVTPESRGEWFRGHDRQRRPLLVDEEDGEIRAWVSFEDFYGRPAYGRTAEISIYIAPADQGRGLGRQLLRAAQQFARDAGIRTLLAFVFAHNRRSMRLFRSAGFGEWGRLPGIAEMHGAEYTLCILGKRLLGEPPPPRVRHETV